MTDLKINSYPLHIGDWHSGTSRMSLAEAGAYIRLCNQYYLDQGEGWTINECLRICSAVAKDEQRAVKSVLSAKFEKTETGYSFPSADETISKMASQPWRWRDREWSRPYMPDAIRLAVFERDGYQCQYCFTMNGPFEVDHIHPVSRGGTDEFENLICACITCNRSKGAKLVSEWRCEV